MSKRCPATQKAVDALPLESGTWRIDGIVRFHVRCRKSKSYFVQRRVDGELVREYFGFPSFKEARALAMRKWSALKPKAANGSVTLGGAIEAYIENRTMMSKMSPVTRKLAE